MKKQNNIFRFLIKTSCMLFLMSCFCSTVNAQVKTCKVTITNNTGERLHRDLSNPGEFEVEKGLPLYWDIGATHELEFKADLAAYSTIWLALDGELPVLHYTYSGLNGGPYPINFSVKPNFVDGKVNANASSLMIYDAGRRYDVDHRDMCMGGNEAGAPLFCVQNDLEVSIHFGSASSTYLTYDKSQPSEPAGETLLPLMKVQILSKEDLTSGITSRDIPYRSDVSVEKLDIADPDNKIPNMHNWFYDPNTKRIHSGNYGTYLDHCLGTDRTDSDTLVVDECNVLHSITWEFTSEGTIKMSGSREWGCITRFTEDPSRPNKLVTKDCISKDILPEQKWIIKSSSNVPGLSAHTIRPADISKQDKCIDNTDNKFGDWRAVKLAECGNELTQNWIFNSNFQIQYASQQDWCLGLPSGRTDNATGITLQKCQNIYSQKWIYDGVKKMIRNYRWQDKCAGIGSGDAMKLYDCEEGKLSHQWKIDGANTVGLNEKMTGSIRPFIHPNHCIDNSAGKTDDDNKIQIWDCGGEDGNNNQKWFFDGYAIRLSNHRDKCLSLASNYTNNGNKIQLYHCKGSSGQEWIYDGVTKTIRLRWDLTKCIDLQNGKTDNGTQIQIWDCNPDNTNMQWTIEQAKPNPNDAVFGPIPLVSNPGKCIDLKSNNVSNGANIQLWPCNRTDAQNWFVQDNQIKLVENPDYCVALKSYDGHDGDDVHLWQCKDQPNEQWIFDVPFQFIRSRVDANMCLNVINDDIKLATCSYGNDKINQQWTLPGGYSEIVTGDNLNIHLVKDDKMCVAMKTIGDATYGYNMLVKTCNPDYSSQKFTFDGSRIKMQNTPDLCVDLENAKAANGTNIHLYTCNGSDAQKWIYDGISENFRSKVDPNMCIDFSNSSATDGTNIQLWNCNDTDAQRFVIK